MASPTTTTRHLTRSPTSRSCAGPTGSARRTSCAGEPCAVALAAHFPGGGFNPVVEAGGPGLDSPGDSLFIFDDQSVTATVSAPSGTTLLYPCAIHPWMQGSIVVQ